MFKFLKIILFFFFIIFSAFFLVGFVMYVVYYLYTNYKEELINIFRKYPQIEYVLRKIASFTSQEMREEDVSIPRTVFKARTRIKRKPITSLNSRQKKILEILRSNNKAEMSDLKKNFSKINVRTLRRDLLKLETLNYITKNGKTKGSFYKLL